MFDTAIRGILAHKIRLFSTALAVMLGVALMGGTLVLTDTINRTFDNLFANVYKGTDAMVRGQSVFSGPNNTGDQRPRVDASLLPTVRGAKGVAAAEGSILGYARLVGKDGKAIGSPASGAPTLGGNWSDVAQLNAFTIVSGHPPRDPADVVIDKKSAHDGELAVGDTTTVLVQGGPQRVHVSGIAKFGKADSPGGASIALFTLPQAQRLIAEPGKYDGIAVVADRGVSQQQLVRNLSPVLPPRDEAVTGATVIKENQDNFHKGLSFFSTLLLVFAVVALLVGGFMIFNTFSITVAQRTRENGLLRALGASRRQILASVLLEALVVGAIASVVGLALGVGVSIALKALLGAIGFDIPTTSVVVTGGAALTCIVAGIGVTLLSALSPARKAGKVPPVAAMQDSIVGSTGYGSKERIFVGSGVLAGGLGLLLLGLFSNIGNRPAVVGLGVLLIFFGVTVLGRTIALPLSRAIGAPLPRLRGVTGELARENAMRNPKRTAASASALMIGVGLVGFISVFATSTKASFNHTVDQSFTGDFVVDSGGGVAGGVDPSLAHKLSALPQVAEATGIRNGSAKINGSVQMLIGVDPDAGLKIVDVQPLHGSAQQLTADAIAVYKNVAKDKHLSIGSRVTAVFPETGARSLRVGLIYGRNHPAGDYFLSTAAYDANFANRLDNSVYIKRAPGASQADTLAAVKSVTRQYPGAKVLDEAGLKAEQVKPLNQLLALVYALLALALIIALMGIANTLALSIFERTRELGLLRAVGMTRTQLRSTIRWESVIVALQGTLLGLVIGVFFGWALVKALKDQGITVFSIPWLSLLLIVLLSAVAGMVAAILPSRRAAKLDVLRAVVTE